MATKPALLRKDFRSETWERLKLHIDRRIEELRTQLESRGNTELTSAATRGALTELRKMLALEQAAQAPAGDQQPGGESQAAAGHFMDEPT
jgi:hypothetical protein